MFCFFATIVPALSCRWFCGGAASRQGKQIQSRKYLVKWIQHFLFYAELNNVSLKNKYLKDELVMTRIKKFNGYKIEKN